MQVCIATDVQQHSYEDIQLLHFLAREDVDADDVRLGMSVLAGFGS